MTNQYAGQQIALLTQHGKERVIAPVLEPALGCQIVHVGHFDTDQLGTFTRDIPRPGSQLEAGRRKARIGMELSGLKIGLASEGSFGPDPYTGMFSWNLEMLVFVDDLAGVEIVGMAQGPGRNGHLSTSDWAELATFAQREGFPEHHMVLRPQGEDDLRVEKGIADWATLRTRFNACLAQAENRQVFAETDLRAFANPSRMLRIAEAAGDLLAKLTSLCPACQAPGFAVTSRVAGLPCEACGTPTHHHKSEFCF